MFKRQRSSKRQSCSREKFDFRFSNFHAIQIPKGWDRLVISLTLAETGRTIAKLEKAVVKNGTCQWKEALCESIYIDSSKAHDEAIVKIVVSTGSTKYNILGEATISLAEYTVSKLCGEISLPLNRCSYGTVLELKLECLTSRSSISLEVKPDINNINQDTKPNASPPLALYNQSPSGSIQSFDLLEGSIRGEDLLATNAWEIEECFFPPPSEEQHINPEIPFNHHEVNKPMKLMEAVKLEAEMWQRNAKKVMIDLDESTEEFLNVSKKKLEPVLVCMKRDMELSKLPNQLFTGEESESMAQIQKAFENTMKCQKNLIDGLNLRLKQNQDCNSELVSVRQEFKQTMGELLSSLKTDLEDMENSIARSFQENKDLQLQMQQLKESEKKLQADIKVLQEEISSKMRNDQQKANNNVEEIESLREKVQELENDCAELTNENLELLFKLKDLSKTQTREYSSTDSTPSVESEVTDPKFFIEEDAKMKGSEYPPEIMEQIHIAFLLLGKSYEDEGSKNEGGMRNSFLGLLQEMNKLLEVKVAESNEKRLELQELERLIAISEENYENIVNELDHERTNSQLKEKQNKLLLEHQSELEAEISTFQLKYSSLQRNTSQLGEIYEMDDYLSGLQEENMQLEECILGLEAETDILKSIDLNCQDKIMELRMEMDVQILALRHILKDVHEQWVETQEENQFLREEIEEETRRLKRDKLELHDKCSELEAQLIDAHKEKERISFEACSEVSHLLADKAELQASLQELMAQVVSSIQSHERLMIDHERTVELLNTYKKREEKLKREMGEIELKLTVSDNKSQQLIKDMEALKIQPQNRFGINSHEEHASPKEFDSTNITRVQNGRKSSTSDAEELTKQRSERTKCSALEIELKDLRQRYLEMSLKYAEVEAQREQLVMKLKEVRGSDKKWFWKKH